jgi:hypothetical protein
MCTTVHVCDCTCVRLHMCVTVHVCPITSGGHDSLRFYANKHDTLGHVYQLGNGDAVALARHQEHSVDANMHHNRISMVIFF